MNDNEGFDSAFQRFSPASEAARTTFTFARHFTLAVVVFNLTAARTIESAFSEKRASHKARKANEKVFSQRVIGQQKKSAHSLIFFS